MKGDFSRSTFDPHKHYTSVRMQQGRVQLDADWNEQADILLHLIATQIQDLLGPGGTSVACPGFAITPVEPVEEPADQGQAGPPEESTAPARTLPDFWIGKGRYYVCGILCENEAGIKFSEQPDYPAAASRLRELADHNHVLVYLDVWQRHITAVEDPAIREIALGGPDTTTRSKTVWQVKLLPLSADPADDQDWREQGGLRSLPGLQAFWAQAAHKGCLQARWDKDKGAVLENHLYRVEIHTVAGDQATFKWSRENGSVVFPVVDLSPEQENGNDTLRVTVEDLDRDPYQLQEGSWVELVDDVTVLDGCPLPLCQVKELDRQKGEVKLYTEEHKLDLILTAYARGLHHPLLRRWEAEPKAIVSEGLDLENGIQIAFRDTGTYQAGDYWLIPARAQTEKGILWPEDEAGQPLARLPQGIDHHYALLALLQSREQGWQVHDLRLEFASLTNVVVEQRKVKERIEAQQREVDARLEEHAGISADLHHRVKFLEERQVDFRELLVQYFQVADEIAVGHVVSVVPPEPSDEPDDELKARLASAVDEDDRRLVVGVVRDIVTGRDEGQACRVVSYGRAQCRAVGNIKPGDVLVPSDKPGYAQKAGRAPQPGTMLGKALGSIKFDAQVMEELEDGKRLGQIDASKRTGMVDMMVLLR